MAAPDRQVFAPIDFRTRFPALDGIRAFAILLVFAEHYGGGSHGGLVLRTLNVVRERGWVGVDIFFVLSGFLITGILYDTLNDSRYIGRFFARRSLRILPVYYGVFLILLVLTPVMHLAWKPQHLWFLAYLGNFTGNSDFSRYVVFSGNHFHFSPNLSHFWSLCVEEQFYLVWPWVVLKVRDRRKLIGTALALSCVALLCRCMFLRWAGPELGERWIMRTLPFRLDSLLVGAVLALLLRGPEADRVQRASRWVFLAGAAAVLAIFLLSPAYDSPWLLTIGLSILAVAAAGLIGMALRVGSPLYRVGTLAPLRTLGRYSYGFYVYHYLFPFAWIQFLIWCGKHIHSIALAGIAEIGSVFLVTFALSKLSFDLFESKILRWKKHFEYDVEQKSHRHAFVTE